MGSKSFLKPKKDLAETCFPKVLIFGGAIVLLIIAPVPIVFAKESFGRLWFPILTGVFIAILSLITWAGFFYPSRLRQRIAEERRKTRRRGKYL